MNIKNYTSEVPAEKSIQRIKNLLIDAHARDIIERYDNRVCVGIAFVIPMENRFLTFELPAKIDRVKKHLIKVKRMRESTAQMQAGRTAWKTLAEWVEIQITMIILDQADPLELFFPYLYDGTQTYYNRLKQNDFKQLTQ